MPEAKNAFALSSLRFSNGRTAIDFSVIGRDAALRRPSASASERTARRSVPTNCQASKAAARSAIVTISAANLRALHCGIFSLGETSSVRFIPSGVISNAQAITSAIGNPSATIATNTFITQAGAS